MNIQEAFNDCKIYQNINNTFIHIPKGKGFNFGYILYLPNEVGNYLIIEGANTFTSSFDIENANKLILDEALCEKNQIYKIANEVKLPVLYPLFPRIIDKNETIYNHTLATNSFNYKKKGLERTDIQLINMFKDVKNRLLNCNILLEDKFIINGFSASGKFANRFTILHPEYVKLCIAGGVSGVLTLPLKKYNWPVGISGLKNVKFNINSFKKVKQFYYMGENDNNDPYIFENGKIKYQGIINKKELIELNKVFSNKRWQNTIKFYNGLNINAKFKTYKNEDHNPICAYNDIINEIKNIIID